MFKSKWQKRYEQVYEQIKIRISIMEDLLETCQKDMEQEGLSEDMIGIYQKRYIDTKCQLSTLQGIIHDMEALSQQ